MTRTRHVLVAILVIAATAAAGVPATPTAASAPGAGAHEAAAAGTQDCSFPVTKVDATGTEVTIEEEPERIVTLAPSAAQTMWEIGAREKVVGVTKFATYLEGAEERANVSAAGQYEPPSTEKVVAQQPDLVLAPNVISNETVEKMREAGLTVYRYRFAATIDDVREKTLLTGELVGECDGASQAVAEMDRKLATVQETVEGEDRPRVLYVFFGYTAGQGTFINEMIEFAGGENIAATANLTGYKQVSQEVVAEQDPEWILLNDNSPTIPKTEAYNSTTAVQEGNVLTLNTNYLNQPAPRIVIPIVKMAKAFHPKAYAEANATATPTPTPTETPEPTATEMPADTPTGTDTATRTPASTDTPGFGPLVAVVGLLAALLLLRRE